MARVTGIGGIFFRCADPALTRAWYREHLGIESESFGAVFLWRDADATDSGGGATIWAPFDAGTDYFDPIPPIGGRQEFMVNYRVDDLDGLLAALRDAGVSVADGLEESEYGRFGWAMDPDGRRIELWEPPPGG